MEGFKLVPRFRYEKIDSVNLRYQKTATDGFMFLE